MLKSIRTLVVVAAGFFALYVALPSTASAAGSTGKTKDETYLVVKEGEDYKVVAASGYNDEVKRLNDENKKKLDEWQDDVKSDKTIPRPKKIIPKKIPITFKTQKGAQDYIDKQLEKDTKNDKAGVPAK